MKTTVYMRVAKTSPRARTRYRFAASATVRTDPLEDLSGPLPTIYFALKLDLPDDAFRSAERILAELEISGDAVGIAEPVVTVAEDQP